MSGVATAVVAGSAVSGYMGSKAAGDAADTSAGATRYAADLQQQQYDQSRQDLAPYREVAVGQEILDADGNVTGYTGGSLNQLSNYGRSQVDPNQIINQGNMGQFQGRDIQSNIPQYNEQGQVSNFGQGSRQGQYQGQNFDMNRDPGVQFRQQEQERSINRNMAGMGKFQSGNRMEELLARSGELASQEYGAAYGRNTQDFQLGQGVNRENYGRDTGEYGLQRGAEDARYGRDNTAYGINRENEQMGYGRQVDAYGRDLTQYNADVSRNQNIYDRQAADYGRQYGQEGDYLNRLAALSQTGQTATNNTATLGAQNAANIGSLTMQGADTQAAAQIGQGQAWQNAIGTGTQAYGYMNQPDTQWDNYMATNKW